MRHGVFTYTPSPFPPPFSIAYFFISPSLNPPSHCSFVASPEPPEQPALTSDDISRCFCSIIPVFFFFFFSHARIQSLSDAQQCYQLSPAIPHLETTLPTPRLGSFASHGNISAQTDTRGTKRRTDTATLRIPLGSRSPPLWQFGSLKQGFLKAAEDVAPSSTKLKRHTSRLPPDVSPLNRRFSTNQ